MFIQPELWDWKGEEERGKRKDAPGQWLQLVHDSRIVETYRKNQRVQFSPRWLEFYELMFILAASGKSFETLMERPEIYDGGFVPVLVGGGLVRRLDALVYRPNPKFGECYKIETLDASNPPPDVEEVFREQPWLWGKLEGMPILNITYGGWNFVQRGRCEK